MELTKIFYVWMCVTFLVLHCVLEGSSEQTAFELPVQLVGFPFIVVAVRVTNFIKKLSYALSPATYKSRARRELIYTDQSMEALDAREVEKYIIAEFGAKSCVFDRICSHYAANARVHPRQQLNWADVFKQYRQSQDQAKELFLLSVFLGDIVGSPHLCHQLGKRRPCDETLLTSIVS
ncbi:PREDICTED: uncharacterized protein LOC106110379 isoform X1 [Papilio polytes]|uniref:uncharacterized protein LOC106110379 isoform X1 n=1 Tax=Papilio polytes TaxID=76194 RepID=UPI0006761BE4|nr:PREDICTED: uncharacterized protein LOC106110379 isoform X1 [Papilio polytes]